MKAITGAWLAQNPQPCRVCGKPQTYILYWPICAECKNEVYATKHLEPVGVFYTEAGAPVVRANYVMNGSAYIKARCTHPAAAGEQFSMSLERVRLIWPETTFILVCNPASGGWVYFLRGPEEDFCTAGLLRGHEAHPETLSAPFARAAWLAWRGA